MEWIKITKASSPYEETHILDLGDKCYMKHLCYSDDGNIVSSSLIEMDRVTGQNAIYNQTKEVS